MFKTDLTFPVLRKLRECVHTQQPEHDAVFQKKASSTMKQIETGKRRQVGSRKASKKLGRTLRNYRSASQ